MCTTCTIGSHLSQFISSLPYHPSLTFNKRCHIHYNHDWKTFVTHHGTIHLVTLHHSQHYWRTMDRNNDGGRAWVWRASEYYITGILISTFYITIYFTFYITITFNQNYIISTKQDSGYCTQRVYISKFINTIPNPICFIRVCCILGPMWRRLKIPVLPIKLCEEWPPAQCGEDGANQNKFFFKSDLLYENWSDKTWDPRKCAEDIKASLENMGLPKKWAEDIKTSPEKMVLTA